MERKNTWQKLCIFPIPTKLSWVFLKVLTYLELNMNINLGIQGK
jgi:hypothetical protein